MSIVAWVTLRSHNVGLRRWQLMQCRKRSSTLRVSGKGSKLAPRVVYCEGKQDEMIGEFLVYREFLRGIEGEIYSSFCV